MRTLIHCSAGAVLCSVLPLLPPLSAPGQTSSVHHIRVAAIDENLRDGVLAALASARDEPGAVVVLDVASSGGRLDIAQAIADAFDASPVPVYTLVNTRAWSSAALIALASDSIYMVPGSSVGGGSWAELGQATQPTILSLRAVFAALVERRGVDALIGEAMVDRQIRIRGMVALGDVLTLDTDAAMETGVATARVTDLAGLLRRLNLTSAEVASSGSGSTGTTVEVTNNHTAAVRIVVQRSGTRYLLGTVAGLGSTAFDVPRTLVPEGARIEVAAELVGSSERTVTEQFRLEPGLVIQWTIQPVLSESVVSRFIRR